MLQTLWGWQPALYLFLGGMGAGAFVTSGVLFLKDPERNKSTIAISMWAAVISLVVGLLLLLSELITPVRGLLMWQSFSNFSSWMTYGAWGAFAAIVVFGLSAVMATEPLSSWLDERWKGYVSLRRVLRKPLAAIGIALGLFVAFYTGMLLMSAPGVPLWNSWLLPCLFTVSGIDTGVALVEVVACAGARKLAEGEKGPQRSLAKVVVCLVLLELVILAVFLSSALGTDAATAEGAALVSSGAYLTSGKTGLAFWGLVVALGLALPLVASVAELALKPKEGKPRRMNAVVCFGALGAIVGGCALRFLMLGAGVHADLVMSALLAAIG